MTKGMRLVSVLAGGTLLAVLSLNAVSLNAQEANETTSHQEVTTQSENPPAETTLSDRLAERKARLKTRLTNAEQARLRSRCKSAQGLLKSFDERVKGIAKTRSNVYSGVIDKLNGIVTKVGDSADTSQLQAEIVALQEKIAGFETSIAAYQQSINDLAEMDCTSDPTAFRASLDEAKALHSGLIDASKEIRAYVNDSIKPVIQSIRAEIARSQPEAIN